MHATFTVSRAASQGESYSVKKFVTKIKKIFTQLKNSSPTTLHPQSKVQNFPCLVAVNLTPQKQAAVFECLKDLQRRSDERNWGGLMMPALT